MKNSSRMVGSMAMIVLVNLIPLYQVIAGEWSVVQIVLLFWLETLLVILIDFAVMTLPLPNHQSLGMRTALRSATVGFALPFVLLQGFAMGMAYFLVEVGGVPLRQGNGFDDTLGSSDLWWAVLAITASHLMTLVQDFRHLDWDRKSQHETIQVAIISRVAVTQFVMIIGMIVAILAGQPIWILLVMVVVKIFIDLLIHWVGHRSASSAHTPTA